MGWRREEEEEDEKRRTHVSIQLHIFFCDRLKSYLSSNLLKFNSCYALLTLIKNGFSTPISYFLLPSVAFLSRRRTKENQLRDATNKKRHFALLFNCEKHE